MSRRAFLDGAQKFAVGGVSAGALLEMLKPNYAWAIQVPPDDSRIVAKKVDVPSPKGNGSIKGYLVASRRRGETAGRPGRAREPGPQPLYRGRRAAPGDRQFHRLRAGRPHFGRRLSGRRREGRRPVQAGRRGQDAGGLRCRRRVAEVPAGFDRQARRDRLLLRRRRRQQARREHGRRTSTPQFRSTAFSRTPPTRRKSRRRSTRNMRSSTRASRAAGRRSTRRSAGPASPTRGTSTKAPITASTTTRRRATTRRRRRRRGKERSIGSTNICGLERGVDRPIP